MDDDTSTISFREGYTPTEDVAQLLVGKSIDSVDIETKTISLSDGALLTVVPNQGSCCPAGDFFLTELNSVENIISSVELAQHYDKSRSNDRNEVYEIFVYAGAVPVAQRLIEVSGNAGNGYYGSGFRIAVSLPEDQGEAF